MAIGPLTQELKHDTFLLEKMKVASRVSLAHNVLMDATLSTYSDYMTDALIANLESYVLRHHLADESKSFDFHFEFPASNWHKFKLRKWPQWLIAHHLLRKVKYQKYDVQRNIEIRSWATFPECTVRYPKELGPIRMFQEVGVAK